LTRMELIQIIAVDIASPGRRDRSQTFRFAFTSFSLARAP
jgi:hypothetical protein